MILVFVDHVNPFYLIVSESHTKTNIVRQIFIFLSCNFFIRNLNCFRKDLIFVSKVEV